MTQKTVRQLDTAEYILIQQDTEVEEIQKDIGIRYYYFPYLFVKLDKSGADYEQVYGADYPYLDADAYLLYTKNFNKVQK
jgi:hypothetical protein